MEASLFTDGSCSANPGRGGWGCLVRIGEEHKTLFGQADNTTNNRMELQGVIDGLKYLVGLETPPSEINVSVISDSTYITNGIMKWLPNWRNNGWFNSVGVEVSNRDLWEEVGNLVVQFKTIRTEWVKGHAGQAENEYVNQVAAYEARHKNGL